MIHFGIAAMTYGGVNVGILQNVNIEMSMDVAKLYAGGSYFPVDTRTHTGNISGSAEFADINAVLFEKLIGGTRTGDTIAVNNTDSPTTFQIVVTITTDSVNMVLTFVKARSTKLALAFSRTAHVIPQFDFECEANDAGQVYTIDLGDVS